MLDFDALLTILRGMESPDVTAGRPASAAAIAASESSLDVRFPPGYRRFLETLGWVDVEGREVFGVGPGDASDVVAHTREWRGMNGVPSRAVIVEIDSLEGGPVGFVPDDADAAAEPPIWRWDHENAIRIAMDFADYLSDVAAPMVAGKEEAPGPVFDPPWGQRRTGDTLGVDRKEIKRAGMVVQRVAYDGVSLAAVVAELNGRRIPARGLPQWTVAAVREVYEAWKNRY